MHTYSFPSNLHGAIDGQYSAGAYAEGHRIFLETSPLQDALSCSAPIAGALPASSTGATTEPTGRPLTLSLQRLWTLRTGYRAFPRDNVHSNAGLASLPSHLAAVNTHVTCYLPCSARLPGQNCGALLLGNADCA